MSQPEDLAMALREEALEAGGKVSLSKLLATVVPVGKLRDLARKYGLSPKGGYRIDKAPAKILAPLLVELDRSEVLVEACKLLAHGLRPKNPRKKKSDKAKDAMNKDLEPILQRKEQELKQTREELVRAREVAARQRERLEEMHHSRQKDSDRAALLRAELESLRRQLAQMAVAPAGDRDQTREIHELERELEELEQIEFDQRRLLAENAARIRELEPLVPEGRRRKKKTGPKEPPPLPDRFRLPRFSQSFYKSLEGMDRRSIEAAYHAILLFCTEGPGYPGLQVKQLEPSPSLWSFRAALKLRVYFRPREDGDVDILALADRQDQHTMLRRLREKL